MARVTFVTGSTGRAGSQQHRRALRKSNGGFQNGLNSSLMRSSTMIPPSNDLLNVFLADRSETVPGKNNITVQSILEKTQTTAAPDAGSSKVRHPAKAA